MATYTVTGGETGDAGVVIGGLRYEPGDTVEITNPKREWLIKAGYLTLADTTPTKAPTKTTLTRPRGDN